jgi:predicted transposase YdaD
MTVDQIRKLHYKQEGREEGREDAIKQLILKQYSKGLSVEYIAEINEFNVEYVRDIVKNSTRKTNN